MDFFPNGTQCHEKATGYEAVILDRRTNKEGRAEYFIHLHGKGASLTNRYWMEADKLLIPGFAEKVESEWFWHFKACGLDDHQIADIMKLHGCPSTAARELAYVMLYGESPDTTAEKRAVLDSANAAMRAGRSDCV